MVISHCRDGHFSLTPRVGDRHGMGGAGGPGSHTRPSASAETALALVRGTVPTRSDRAVARLRASVRSGTDAALCDATHGTGHRATPDAGADGPLDIGRGRRRQPATPRTHADPGSHAHVGVGASAQPFDTAARAAGFWGTGCAHRYTRQCPKTLRPESRTPQGSPIDPGNPVSRRESRRRTRCVTPFPLCATAFLDIARPAVEPHGVKSRAKRAFHNSVQWVDR